MAQAAIRLVHDADAPQAFTRPVTLTAEQQAARRVKHAKGFFDMEGPLSDLDHMAAITADLAGDVFGGPSTDIPRATADMVLFAIYHLAEMVHSLKKKYDEDY